MSEKRRCVRCGATIVQVNTRTGAAICPACGDYEARCEKTTDGWSAVTRTHLTPTVALRGMIRATDAVLDEIQARMECPFCPADDVKPHRRGCELIKLLRAREEAGYALSTLVRSAKEES